MDSFWKPANKPLGALSADPPTVQLEDEYILEI